MNQDSPIREVKGIGEKTEELFHHAGVYTVGDILLYFPRAYEKFPEPAGVDEVRPEEKNALLVRIAKRPAYIANSRLKIVTMDAAGAAGKVRFSWYRSPYVRSRLKVGESFVFYGTVKEKKGILAMDQPEIYTPQKYESVAGSLQPVYSLTAGLSNRTVQRTVRWCLDHADPISDSLPAEIRERNGLCGRAYALENIHFPLDEESCIRARNRLVFDEFLLFSSAMRADQEEAAQEKSAYVWKEDGFLQGVIEKLPYTLTGAQKKVLSEIRSDLESGFVMERLVQGDVGSGKTVIAFLAMLDAAHRGFQSALMAPTEVLARQHYEKLAALLRETHLPYHVVLLTGSLSAAEKREAYRVLREEPDAMAVGTHALFQERPEYRNLALVITDEQHRFGVRQREGLARKGKLPHILVMSATPIPRTLAVILYGDLAVSVIDEVPAKRLPIKNCVVDAGYREKAWNFIEKQVLAGRQAYVICPFVEPSEVLEGENVLDYAEKMRERFRGICTVGCLHGRMKPEEKTRVMEAFQRNEIKILVSTTVVEVGVDVPNASVMMVEDAQRFGLAQLHQLRGRVGRGEAQSYCIFIDSSGNPRQNERLEVLNHTNDGFEIAEQDLKMRGPGDFFGIRQSGDLSFRLADVYQDSRLLEAAAEEAGRIEREHLFEKPEYAGLKAEAAAYRQKLEGHLNL